MMSPFLGAGTVLVLIWLLWGNDVYPIPLSRIPQTYPSPTKKPVDRPLILFAFFETELSRRNLEFFLKHSVHNAAGFLFLINGETDVANIIPSRQNIRYIRKKKLNECFDLGSFAEVLIKDDLYKKYNRFIMMNGSIRGPFFQTWSTACWSDIYLDRITNIVKVLYAKVPYSKLPLTFKSS